MSNRAKKKGPRPHEKISRGEAQTAFQNVANDINGIRVAVAWIGDFLIEKGVFTDAELKSYFDKKRAETLAAMQASTHPDGPEASPCLNDSPSTMTTPAAA